MITTPESPAIPVDQQGRGDVRLRYEDITQDGRVQMRALPAMLGEVAWRGILDRSPLALPLLQQGILPLLSRLVFVGEPGPFTVESLFDVECRFAAARQPANGPVERLFLNMWAEAHAPHGLTHGPLPDGPPVLAGRLFAEHVFTRPFGDPSQRRVRELPDVDVNTLPAYAPNAPIALLDVPADATPIDEKLVVDEVPVVFGISHTDANQHVNSLVYPRVVEDAALRHFRRHGRGALWLVRALEIAFMRPCFAGETLRLAMRAWSTEDGRLGVGAILVGEEDAAKLPDTSAVKPRAVCRAVFEE